MPTTTTPLFDTRDCGRCGGSGRYSYNALDGDRCYGCGGSGQVIVPSQRALADNYREAKRTVQRPQAVQLAVGDELARDGNWVRVNRLAIDYSRPTGWSGAERRETAWAMVVDLADGTTLECSTNSLLRRRSSRAAIDALLGPATLAHVQARRAAAAQVA